jgi:hypothetical protein
VRIKKTSVQWNLKFWYDHVQILFVLIKNHGEKPRTRANSCLESAAAAAATLPNNVLIYE